MDRSVEINDENGPRFTLEDEHPVQSGMQSMNIEDPQISQGEEHEEAAAEERYHRLYMEGVVMTSAFVISVLVIYIVGSIIKPELALMIPLAFVPSLCFLGWWYYSPYKEQLSIHSLVYSYALAFYLGSFCVTIYQLILLLILVVFSFGAINTDAGYYIVLFLFVIFGLSLGPEVMKFIIAFYGKKMRPDMQSTHSYLMYTCSAALGFATFFIILSQIVERGDLADQFLYLLLRIVLDIPLHVVSGCLIGTYVAKNMIYSWNIHWTRILIIPVICRAIPVFVFYAMVRGGSPAIEVAVVFAVLYAIALMVILFLTRHQLKSLPATFGRVADNDDLPNPFAAEEL